MLIKTLRLENFRQFKGVTQINFSCDAERNVTVILGNNTFGKTTLLQAFNWCLYGEVNFDNDKDLLNRELAARMKNGERETVSVEISLLHDGTEYIVTRTQRYTCGGGKVRGEVVPTVMVSRKCDDGQTRSIDSERKMSELINSWLPKELSTYFFFDTERISTVSQRRDIAAAVKNFLGLSALENTLRHLGDRSLKSTVIGRIYGSMDSDGDAEAQNALNAAQTAREKREVIAKQLEECKDQIDRYEERKSELEKILRDNQSTSELQKEIDKLERRIADEKKCLVDATESFFRNFNADAMKFFLQPLLGHAYNFLTTLKIADKGVRDVTKATIDELIQRGQCLCGREICPDNDAYRHLKAQLDYVPPESIGVTVRHYRERLKFFSREAARVYDGLRQRYEEIYRCKERIAEWEDDLADLREKIFGKENMARYESEHADIRKRLRDLNATKDSLNHQDGALARDIESYQKAYDTLTARSQKIARQKNCSPMPKSLKRGLNRPVAKMKNNFEKVFKSKSTRFSTKCITVTAALNLTSNIMLNLSLPLATAKVF